MPRTRNAALLLCIAALLACKLGDKGSAPSASAPVASAPAPASLTEIKFTDAVPRPGTKSTAERKLAFKVEAKGKVSRNSQVTSGGFEVQASDEFRVTKAAVDVKELYELNQEAGGEEKKKVSPLAGSRYVVTRTDDGKLSALDANGTTVAPAQLKLLKDEFGDAFEKNQSGAFLPDRPVKIGEKLIPAGDSVLKMLSLKDDGTTTFDGIEFILSSGTPERATFDVTMTMTQKLNGGLRMRAKLKGQIDLKPAGKWLLRVDLKGPLEVLDNAGSAKASGDLAVNATETYL